MPDAPSHGATLDAFERRLNDETAALMRVGLTEDEARLIAARRAGTPPAATPADTRVALALGLAAALAIKAPALFGVPFAEANAPFYARNLSLFVLPLLTGYFVWKRRVGVATCLWLALPFAAAAVFANVFPFRTGSHTGVLTALHLPLALWLAVGIAYVGGRWSRSGRRMDFVRFSGELFIYSVLLALGGGVLTALTVMMFNAIAVNIEWVAGQWLVPCGAMGAVMIGAWQFLRGDRPFAALDEWQISFLPVYSAWAALVVIAFPPLFGYQ
jgi:hypothetical protein